MTPGHFLNVNLEIESASDLAPLQAALGPDAVVLYCGAGGNGFQLVLETNPAQEGAGPIEATCSALCRIIEALPAEARAHWDGAYRRTFDIGLEATPGEVVARLGVATAMLGRIVALGGEIAVTVYEPEAEEGPGEGPGPGQGSGQGPGPGGGKRRGRRRRRRRR